MSERPKPKPRPRPRPKPDQPATQIQQQQPYPQQANISRIDAPNNGYPNSFATQGSDMYPSQHSQGSYPVHQHQMQSNSGFNQTYPLPYHNQHNLYSSYQPSGPASHVSNIDYLPTATNSTFASMNVHESFQPPAWQAKPSNDSNLILQKFTKIFPPEVAHIRCQIYYSYTRNYPEDQYKESVLQLLQLEMNVNDKYGYLGFKDLLEKNQVRIYTSFGTFQRLFESARFYYFT